MKTLCWNICGLGKLRAVNRLRNKLRDICPHLLFFMVTKVNAHKMTVIRRKCEFNNGIDVDTEGFKGGLSLG